MAPPRARDFRFCIDRRGTFRMSTPECPDPPCLKSQPLAQAQAQTQAKAQTQTQAQAGAVSEAGALQWL